MPRTSAFPDGHTRYGDHHLSRSAPGPVYQWRRHRLAGLSRAHHASNYSQQYNGFDLTATKRLSHKLDVPRQSDWNNYTNHAATARSPNPTAALPGVTRSFRGSRQVPGGQVARSRLVPASLARLHQPRSGYGNLTGAYIIAVGTSTLVRASSARQGYPHRFRDNVQVCARYRRRCARPDRHRIASQCLRTGSSHRQGLRFMNKVE